MNTEMIEKVAKAIHAATNEAAAKIYPGSAVILDWCDADEKRKSLYLAVAKAAIGAVDLSKPLCEGLDAKGFISKWNLPTEPKERTVSVWHVRFNELEEGDIFYLYQDEAAEDMNRCFVVKDKTSHQLVGSMASGRRFMPSMPVWVNSETQRSEPQSQPQPPKVQLSLDQKIEVMRIVASQFRDPAPNQAYTTIYNEMVEAITK